jgi:hypothetical protein
MDMPFCPTSSSIASPWDVFDEVGAPVVGGVFEWLLSSFPSIRYLLGLDDSSADTSLSSVPRARFLLSAAKALGAVCDKVGAPAVAGVFKWLLSSFPLDRCLLELDDSSADASFSSARRAPFLLSFAKVIGAVCDEVEASKVREVFKWPLSSFSSVRCLLGFIASSADVWLPSDSRARFLLSIAEAFDSGLVFLFFRVPAAPFALFFFRPDLSELAVVLPGRGFGNLVASLACFLVVIAWMLGAMGLSRLRGG